MDRSQVRLSKLSDISSDIAQVALASIVIPFFIDKSDLGLLISGVAIALTFWTVSVLLAR